MRQAGASSSRQALGASRRSWLGGAVATAVLGAEAYAQAPAIGGRFAHPIGSTSADLPSLEAFGAVGDGRADDDGAFARAVEHMRETGAPVRLVGGRTYVLNRRLDIPDGGGLVSAGGAVVFAPASSFDNQDGSFAGRYGPNAVVIDLSGETDGTRRPRRKAALRGFAIRSEPRAGRVLTAVAARNCVDLAIEGLEISGFPLGCGIRAATLAGDCRISRNHIHGFHDQGRRPGETVPQITGIEIDNDRVGGVASAGFEIAFNRIEGLTLGRDFVEAHGWQTDGVNILFAGECVVHGNRISRVGEGIDTFGSHATITGNVLDELDLFGIKLVHGASYNVVSANVVRRAGLAGIVLAGSPDPNVPDCAWNTVSGNVVRDIDPHGRWKDSSSACVMIQENRGRTSRATNNRITDNILDPGERGAYAVARLSTGTNAFLRNTAVRPGRQGVASSGDDKGPLAFE